MHVANYRNEIRRRTPDNKIVALGKYAYGDAIWMYNIACNTAKTLGETVDLEVHWNWDRDFYHSFDDHENIIDQVDYLYQFYHLKDSVRVNHIYNTRLKKEDILRRGSKLRYGADPLDVDKSNWWVFNPELKLKPHVKKVVVWNSYGNAEPSPKEILTRKEWTSLIDNLKSCGYTVVEVCYRTPIRELMYHINTASSCIGYSGLCYQIANNWCVPCMVITDRSMVNLYSPCVLKVHDKNVIDMVTRNYDTYGEEMLTEVNEKNRNKIKDWIDLL